MASKSTIESLKLQIQDLMEDDRAAAGESGAFAASSSRRRKMAASLQDIELEDTDTPEKAFKRIVAILNVADKSELAIRQKLEACGFSELSIEESVSRAKEYGFIDDKRYGELLVRSRVAQGKGSLGIEHELRSNGIEPESVPGFPHEFNIEFEQELERALQILERKPPHSKNKRDAAYRKLVQKGYPSQVASTAARSWFETICD